MRRVINGTKPERFVLSAGSGLSQIFAPMAAAGAGAVGGPLGAVAGGAAGTALTQGARAVSDRIVAKNAEIARAIIANGGMKNLPVASETTSRIIEQLMRQTAAAGPQ